MLVHYNEAANENHYEGNAELMTVAVLIQSYVEWPHQKEVYLKSTSAS